MKNNYWLFKVLVFVTVAGIITGCTTDNDKGKEQQLTIVPYPNKILKRNGTVTFSQDFWVIANVSDSSSAALATFLVKELKRITGQEILITDIFSTRKHSQSVRVELEKKKEDSEAYELDITSRQIKIKSGTANGIYYGIVTLLQILENSQTGTTEFEIQKMVIKDFPQLLTRGILISPSQLNSKLGDNIFSKMGKLKLNSLVLSGDIHEQSDWREKGAKHFVRIKQVNEISENTNLINYGATMPDINSFYSSFVPRENSKGLIVNLTTSKNIELQNKMIVMAELSWTDKAKHDFDRIKTAFIKN